MHEEEEFRKAWEKWGIELRVDTAGPWSGVASDDSLQPLERTVLDHLVHGSGFVRRTSHETPAVRPTDPMKVRPWRFAALVPIPAADRRTAALGPIDCTPTLRHPFHVVIDMTGRHLLICDEEERGELGCTSGSLVRRECHNRYTAVTHRSPGLSPGTTKARHCRARRSTHGPLA
jgi:hypothetical protein